MRFAPVFDKNENSPSYALINIIIIQILGQYLEDYTTLRVGRKVNVSRLACADYIVILGSSNRGIQGLFEAANHHATAVGKRINVSKTKVMLALMPGEQRQTVFLDGEPLENVDYS